MSASTGLSAKLDQQARGAIFFLLLATLALQISWVLPLFGLAGTPVARHLIRMVTKWFLFIVFIRMMRSGKPEKRKHPGDLQGQGGEQKKKDRSTCLLVELCR